MKKLLLIILCISGLSAGATAQVDSARLRMCKQQVVEINSLSLRKVYISSIYNYPDKESSWKFTLRNKNDPGNEYILYVDEQNRIRKYISYDNTEDYGWQNISYYDTTGSLCYVLFRDDGFTGNDISAYAYHDGYIYSMGDSIIQGEVKYEETGNNNTTLKLEYQTLHNGSITKLLATPEIIRIHPTTEELLSTFNFSEVIVPAKSARVSFVPNICGFSYVNRNDVLVREGPGTSYPLVEEYDKPFKLNVGIDVGISEIAKKEAIGELGTHCWYKTNFGYIYGAFIEPVEQKIE